LLHNHVEKTHPQPLLQPDKPQNTPQNQNTAQNTAVWKTCTHKTLTTTTKRKTHSEKGKLVESMILKLSIQQQPTWKKAGYFNNNNQTNQKPQPKPETNPKKQPEKTLLHTKRLQQQPKRRNRKGKRSLFILLYSLLAYFALR
jgi:hypothetical protein